MDIRTIFIQKKQFLKLSSIEKTKKRIKRSFRRDSSKNRLISLNTMNGECRSIDGRYQIPDECHEFRIRKRFPHTTREFVKKFFHFFYYCISEPRELHGKLCYKSFWLLYYIHNISTRHKAMDLLDILYAIAKLWESIFVRRFAALREIYM